MQPTDPNKFTDKAWEAVVKSQEVTQRYQQQQLEVEHLIISLLEPNELAYRILSRAGIEPTQLVKQLEALRRVSLNSLAKANNSPGS